MSDEYNAELDAALLKMQLVRLKAKVERLEAENAGIGDLYLEIDRLEAKVERLTAAAEAVDSATKEARKRYGEVITFELACKLDALTAALEGK